MNKRLIQFIGIQIIVIGLILSVFEFLIDNSELIVGIGVIVLIISFVDLLSIPIEFGLICSVILSQPIVFPFILDNN